MERSWEKDGKGSLLDFQWHGVSGTGEEGFSLSLTSSFSNPPFRFRTLAAMWSAASSSQPSFQLWLWRQYFLSLSQVITNNVSLAWGPMEPYLYLVDSPSSSSAGSLLSEILPLWGRKGLSFPLYMPFFEKKERVTQGRTSKSVDGVLLLSLEGPASRHPGDPSSWLFLWRQAAQYRT